MITNLEQLYFDQLRDLFSAEKQLIAALPEMASHASHEELRDAHDAHQNASPIEIGKLGESKFSAKLSAHSGEG